MALRKITWAPFLFPVPILYPTDMVTGTSNRDNFLAHPKTYEQKKFT